MNPFLAYFFIVIIFNLMWLINHGTESFGQLYSLWGSKKFAGEFSLLILLFSLSGIASGIYVLVIWLNTLNLQ